MPRTKKKADPVATLATIEQVEAVAYTVPPGWEHYTPALEALQNGESVAAAARVVGVSRQALWEALQKFPELASDVQRRRAALREVVNLKAMAVLDRRLDNPDAISNRDLTDILRAIKPPHEDLGSNFKIRLDIAI